MLKLKQHKNYHLVPCFLTVHSCHWRKELCVANVLGVCENIYLYNLVGDSGGCPSFTTTSHVALYKLLHVSLLWIFS